MSDQDTDPHGVRGDKLAEDAGPSPDSDADRDTPASAERKPDEAYESGVRGDGLAEDA